MPEHFPFIHEHRDGLELFRWLGDPALPGWKRGDLWGPATPRFVGEYGVSGSAALLYPALLGLAWHLTSGLQRFALPEFDGVADCERLGRPYELVQWEYGIDWEQPDWPSRDQGFVPASHYRHISGGDDRPMSFSRPRGAALAPVSGWADVMSIMPFGDQANTLCVFGVAPMASARDRLLASLRSDSSPQLKDVVREEDDIFAVTTQEDEGLGQSSLLLVGRERLRSCFSGQLERLERRVETYLAETATAETNEAWCSAIDDLADIRTS